MSDSEDQKTPDENPLEIVKKAAETAATNEPEEPEFEEVQDANTQALSDALSSSFIIVKILMVVLIVAFLGSGVFRVKSNQEAILLRFGKATRAETLKPGLHWAFPYPIDEKVFVPVRESHSARATNGWYAISPEAEALGEIPMGFDYLQPGIDGYTLTSDGNVIHCRLTVQYQISDAQRHEFVFANLKTLLSNVMNNALVYASGQFTAEDAIYKNRLGFKDAVVKRLSEKLAETSLGITVETAEVETSPPLWVKESFEQVQSAEQERSKKISEAEGYRNEVLNKAQGEAAEVIRGGIAESNRVVLAVAGDADYFQAQLPSYLSDPELFKQRLLIQTMEQIFTNAQEKHWLPNRTDGKTRELRLLLSREPQKVKND